MNKTVFALVSFIVAILFAAGCGDEPSAVVEANVDALNRRDYGTIYDNFASSSPIRDEYSRSDYVDTAEDELNITSEFSMTGFEVIEEEVQDDHAVVSWRATVRGDPENNGEISDVTMLVKENGVWKVIE